MRIVLYSGIAGIAGMGLGAALSAVITNISKNLICWLLCFAGGVMISLVCFGLVPEAISHAGMPLTVFGLVLGIGVIMALNGLVDGLSGKAGDKRVPHRHGVSERMSDTADSAAMRRSGLVMLAAISLHNLPEGIAIGAAGSADTRLGATLAVMIALHDIPEGVAIAAPLIAGGIGKGRAILLASLSGAVTLVGGMLGALAGGLSDNLTCVALAAAGGSLLYVVFGEIIPQTATMAKERLAAAITLSGVLAGLVITGI